jgi:Replication Fork Protection Component Swi3
VFGTFREALHRQRSGRGNPAKDLGILLDLYEQWQKQVFPHTDFDTFIKKVAGLYGKPGGKQTTGATLKVRFFLGSAVESIDCIHPHKLRSFTTVLRPMLWTRGVQGDVRELRESVIQVALDNMVESLDNGEPLEGGLDEGMAQEQSDDEHARPAGKARPGDSMAQSAAGAGLFEPLQELPVDDNTGTQGITDLGSQAIGKGGGMFDPDELMQLQPAFVEDGGEFDDMLC